MNVEEKVPVLFDGGLEPLRLDLLLGKLPFQGQGSVLKRRPLLSLLAARLAARQPRPPSVQQLHGHQRRLCRKSHGQKLAGALLRRAQHKDAPL